MFEIKWLSDVGANGALLGGVGGAARYVSGVVPVRNWFREIAILIIISAPAGWLANGLAVDYGHTGYILHCASISAGLAAQNIVKFLILADIKELINAARGK